MTIAAADTGNEFADAWNGADAVAARQAALPQAVAADGGNAQVDEYRAAWDRENHGQYGDIHQANATPEGPATNAATALTGFRQQGANLSPMQLYMRQWNDPTSDAMTQGQWNQLNMDNTAKGGFGAWNYGDAAPTEGNTNADFDSYWSHGGADPSNFYGRGTPSATDLFGSGSPGHGNNDGAAASGAAASAAASASAGQDGAGSVGVGVL